MTPDAIAAAISGILVAAAAVIAPVMTTRARRTEATKAAEATTVTATLDVLAKRVRDQDELIGKHREEFARLQDALVEIRDKAALHNVENARITAENKALREEIAEMRRELAAVQAAISATRAEHEVFTRDVAAFHSERGLTEAWEKWHAARRQRREQK